MYAIKFVKLTAALSSLVIGINAEAQLLGRGGSIGGAFGGTMGSAMNGSVNNMSSSQDMFSGRGRAIKNNATSAVDGNADAVRLSRGVPPRYRECCGRRAVAYG